MEIKETWNWNDSKLAKNFDNHINEQLPWYPMLTRIVRNIGKCYIPQHGTYYDIGCSTGNMSNNLKDILEQKDCESISIDSSQEMLDNFIGYGKKICDDAASYPYLDFDFATSFLTLTFIPVKNRRKLISNLKNNLNEGGAIVFVERCIPEGGYPSLVMQRSIWSEKKNNGASAENILNKEISLSGVQIPIDPNLFEGYYEFFRLGDFRGWIVEN